MNLLSVTRRRRQVFIFNFILFSNNWKWETRAIALRYKCVTNCNNIAAQYVQDSSGSRREAAVTLSTSTTYCDWRGSSWRVKLKLQLKLKNEREIEIENEKYYIVKL
jgi:hypothetical protein